jgi:ferredoxin/flavodoxin
MFAKIIYFSGTGNTAYIASYIEKQLKSRGVEVLCLALENTRPEENIKADVLYFGFPIYACEMPLFVKEYIKQLPEGQGTKIRLFCTKAYFSGKAMIKAAQLFKQKGYQVLSWYERKMPGSDGLAFLKKEGRAAKKLIANFSPDPGDLDCWLANQEEFDIPEQIYDPAGALFGWLLEAAMAGIKKKYHADDRCISCGLCARICPPGNIALKDGKVIFSNKCILCMRCIHQCPVEAIQIGKLTSGKFRYKGPDGSFKPVIKN